MNHEYATNRAERNRIEREIRVEKLARIAVEKLASIHAHIAIDLVGEATALSVASMDSTEREALVSGLTKSHRAARITLQAFASYFGDPNSVATSALAAVVAAHAGYIVLPPPEPSPIATDGPSVWLEVIEDLAEGKRRKVFTSGMEELVSADMSERDAVGRERYGRALQSHNGRDALRDAYEEGLDRSVYRRQALDEIVDGPVDFGLVTRLAETRVEEPIGVRQTLQPIEIDRVVRARAYLVAVATVLKDREEIERRNDAKKRGLDKAAT